MKKKEIIILSVLGGIVLLVFLYKKFGNQVPGMGQGTNTEAITNAPNYTAEEYEESSVAYQKFNIFQEQRQQAQTAKSKVIVTPDGDTLLVDAAGNVTVVSSAGKANTVVTQNGDTLSVDANGNVIEKEKSFFGFGTPVTVDSTAVVPSPTPKPKPKPVAQSKKTKTTQNRGKGVIKSVTGSKDSVSKTKGKKRIVPKKEEEPPQTQTQFYSVNIDIPQDTTRKDSLKEKETVLKFFKAEFYSSQSLRKDKSIKVKVLEEVVTPNSTFPAGTIFYGNVTQKGRRFVSSFHRALYNYGDYPLHEPMDMFDMTYTEGMLILDFEDEIKDESSDEFLTANTDLAAEVAAQQAIANSMVRMAEGATKSVKKQKIYTIEVSDGEDILVGIRVPKKWFYDKLEEEK